MLTFAIATAGNTVFAPSPVNPESRPLTSKVGRAQVRYKDGPLDVTFLADAQKLDLIGRLGGEAFTRTRDTFSLERPD